MNECRQRLPDPTKVEAGQKNLGKLSDGAIEKYRICKFFLEGGMYKTDNY